MISSIVSLFFPRAIGRYYIIPAHEVAIYVTPTTVEAIHFYFYKYDKTIVKSWSFFYENDQELAKHIDSFYKTLPTSTYVRLIVKSSSLFLCQMESPFTHHEKIKATLPFELESRIPVSLSETLFDFIITSQTANTTSLLAAIVPYKALLPVLKVFEDLNIGVDILTLDVIEFYIISSKIAQEDKNALSIFISQDSNSLILLLFHQGKCVSIRNIFKKNNNEKTYIEDLIFTVKTIKEENSFASLRVSILFSGIFEVSSVELLNNTFSTTASYFSTERYLQKNNIKVLSPDVATSYHCLSSLYNSEPPFNLPHQLTTIKQVAFFQKNIIAATFLTLTIFGLLAFHMLTQIASLEKVLHSNQTKLLQAMQKTFPSVQEEWAKKSRTKKTPSLKTDILKALEFAKKDIDQEQSIVTSLSAENRNSFLEYLSILSTSIDRETIGLNLKKLIITPTTITLEGQVRDFDTLSEFEKALKDTKLFVSIPDLQKIDFSIPLMLVQKGTTL